MIKAIIFDLDGTLLPMNEDEFVKAYFGLLCKKLVPLGFDKDELIKTVWAGTNAMIKNDGTLFNEDVFWNTFTAKYGENSINNKEIFDNFYSNEFKQTKITCGENPLARIVIDQIKAKKLKVILASRPVFPLVAMLTRAEFIGLNKDDFDYISCYENSKYTKPNPKFYEEVLKNNNLLSSEAIYFGNSETEDYIPATTAGIKTYLIDNEKGIMFDEITDIINQL